MSDDDLESLLAKVGRAPPRPLGAAWFEDDRYEIRAPLGEGSFGAVYEAFDRARGELVALKLLRVRSADALLRFKREFRVMAEIRAPGLVRLHELHGDGERWYFTMELVRGARFDAHCRDPARARPALEALGRALGELHGAGLVHRDVKPSNVLVTPEGRVVILDFGLVRGQDDVGTAIVGTPTYVAPEVLAGAEPTPASDWYSVGVMLHEILTGSAPFDGSSEGAMAEKRARPAPRVRDKAPNAPADLAELCDGLLARAPEERPRGYSAPPRPAPSALFVGRARELAALDAAARRPRSITHVFGASGAGKSALAQAWVESARRGGARAYLSRCHARAHVPFGAIDEIVDRLARELARLPAPTARALAPRDTSSLVGAFPVFESAPGFERRPGAERSQRGAATALCELLERWDPDARWVLVIDDAQWGDADSGAVLTRLLGAARLALSIVLVFRGPPSGPLAETLRPHASMEIGPLEEGDARALARRIGAAERVDDVVREAAGSPLVLVELARARTGDAAATSFADVVASRWRASSEDARRAASILALARRPVRLGVLGVLGVPAVALDELVALPLASAQGDSAFGLVHDRVAEVLRELVTPDAARALHRELAAAYASASPERHDLVTHHLTEAGDLASAAAEALLAARAARAARAFARARADYARTFELLERSGAPIAPALRVERAEMLSDAGLSVPAAEAFLAASRGVGEGEARELRLRAAEQLLTSGHLARGERLFDDELARHGVAPPDRPATQLLRVVGAQAMARLDRLRPRPASRARLEALWIAFRTEISVRPLRSMALGAELVREAARPGAPEPAREAAAFVEALGLVSRRGPEALPRALAILAQARPPAPAPSAAVTSRFFEGTVRYFGLDLAGASAAFDATAELSREHALGHSFGDTLGRALRSATAWILGDVAHLASHAPALRAELDERDHLMAGTLVGMHDAWLRLVEVGSGVAVAERDVLTIEQRWSSRSLDIQGWWGQMARSMFALARGDARLAERLTGPGGRPYFERVLASAMHELERIALHARATIALLAEERRGSRARELERTARDAIRRLRAASSAWTRALAACLDAGLASTTADADATLRALAVARAAVDEAGMPLAAILVDRTRGELQGGDAGAALRADASARLAALGVDADVAMAITLPGAWRRVRR